MRDGPGSSDRTKGSLGVAESPATERPPGWRLGRTHCAGPGEAAVVGFSRRGTWPTVWGWKDSRHLRVVGKGGEESPADGQPGGAGEGDLGVVGWSPSREAESPSRQGLPGHREGREWPEETLEARGLGARTSRSPPRAASLTWLLMVVQVLAFGSRLCRWLCPSDATSSRCLSGAFLLSGTTAGPGFVGSAACQDPRFLW